MNLRSCSPLLQTALRLTGNRPCSYWKVLSLPKPVCTLFTNTSYLFNLSPHQCLHVVVCVQTVMRSGKYICSHHLFLEHTKNVSQGGVSYLSLAWQLILRRWHRLSVSHWEIDRWLSSSRASPHKPYSLFLLFINIYDDIYCIYCVWKIIPTGFQDETTHQDCRQIYLQ